MAGNSSNEVATNLRLIRAAKPEETCAFAFGLSRNAADSFLAVDKVKQPKALETDAKKGAASGAKVFSGSVHFDGSRAVFTTEDAPPGSDKALTDWFRHHKATLAVTVAKPQALEPPVSQNADEGLEDGPAIYATETLARRFQAALRNPQHFAFGPGRTPDESLLALHPRREGTMLFRALRQQNKAIRGSWGTLEMDGRVAVFRCEEKPIPGLRKQVRAFLKERELRYRVQVFGPEGEVIEPGDEEEDAADPQGNAAPTQGQQEDGGELATLRQRMAQMLPTLQEIARTLPPRSQAVRDQYQAFDTAQKANDLATARTAFGALLDIGRAGRADMAALQELRKRADALLPELQKAAAVDAALRGPIREQWQQCDGAIKGGDVARGRVLLTELAALLPSGGMARAPGGTVAYRQLLLRWRQAQATVSSNLDTLGRALLANGEVQADPRFAQVQRAVGRLSRLVPQFGEALDDALDAAMNAGDQAGPQGLNRAALTVLSQYRTQLQAQPALSTLEQVAKLCGAGDLKLHREFTDAMDELQQTLAAAA